MSYPCLSILHQLASKTREHRHLRERKSIVPAHCWRNIAISLVDPDFVEQTGRVEDRRKWR
jgi:hypothetical protein